LELNHRSSSSIPVCPQNNDPNHGHPVVGDNNSKWNDGLLDEDQAAPPLPPRRNIAVPSKQNKMAVKYRNPKKKNTNKMKLPPPPSYPPPLPTGLQTLPANIPVQSGSVPNPQLNPSFSPQKEPEKSADKDVAVRCDNPGVGIEQIGVRCEDPQLQIEHMGVRCENPGLGIEQMGCPLNKHINKNTRASPLESLPPCVTEVDPRPDHISMIPKISLPVLPPLPSLPLLSTEEKSLNKKIISLYVYLLVQMSSVTTLSLRTRSR
jgi:hypothetical protein